MKRKHDELSSLAVKSLVCKEADEFAGLPALWRGQEVGEVGPIEPLPEHVSQEPYSLPQRFHWATLGSDNVEEVAKFICRHDNEVVNLSQERFIEFNLAYPNTESKWLFGVQTTVGKLVAVVLAIPFKICVGRETQLFINGAVIMKCLKNYENKGLRCVLIKELVRRSNLSKINQLILSSISIFKPVTTVTRWECDLCNLQLPCYAKTPGWRRMTLEDVSATLALVNKWSSQFVIRPIFNSEEEFSYNFLCQKWVISFVVEDKAYNITDFISFSLLNMSHCIRAFVTIVVIHTDSS